MILLTFLAGCTLSAIAGVLINHHWPDIEAAVIRMRDPLRRDPVLRDLGRQIAKARRQHAPRKHLYAAVSARTEQLLRRDVAAQKDAA